MKKFSFILGAILFALNAATAATALQLGQKAPVVSAKNEEGKPISLKYGDGYTLVYFYPKADTPGCTAQACSLRDAYQQLDENGVKIYGVSTDTPADQKKFKQKYGLPFTLISDIDGTVAKAFGVPVNGGFTARQAFLVKDGKLAWIDRSASTKEQANDVLEFIKSTKEEK